MPEPEQDWKDYKDDEGWQDAKPTPLPGYPKFQGPKMETSALGVFEGGPTDTNPSGSKVPRSIQNSPDWVGDTIAGAAGVGSMAPAADVALPAMGRFAVKHPLITQGLASAAIGGARKIPVVGKMIPPYAEMLPFFAGKPRPEEDPLLTETRQAVKGRQASMIPTRIRSGRAGSMMPTEGVGATAESPTFIPEPRSNFSGENEGYMASVPREDLDTMALRRKPGAGKQLQQLGKPVIYIPSGSDLP